MPMTFPDGGTSRLEEDFYYEDNLYQVKDEAVGEDGISLKDEAEGEDGVSVEDASRGEGGVSEKDETGGEAGVSLKDEAEGEDGVSVEDASVGEDDVSVKDAAERGDGISDGCPDAAEAATTDKVEAELQDESVAQVTSAMELLTVCDMDVSTDVRSHRRRVRRNYKGGMMIRASRQEAKRAYAYKQEAEQAYAYKQEADRKESEAYDRQVYESKWRLPQEEELSDLLDIGTDIDLTLEPDEEDDIYNPNKVLVGHIALKCLRVVTHSSDDEERVLSSIHRMSIDRNCYVRTDLMEYVPYMVMFCDNEILPHVIEDYIIPWVLNGLSDPIDEVKKAAQSSLVALLDRSFLSTTVMEEKLCPTIVQLVGDDGSKEECALLGNLKIMCHIAQKLGQEKAESFFLKKFCSSFKHTSYKHRLAGVSYFIDFAMVISQRTVEKVLVPLLVELCDDKHLFVRKACSVVILSLSCMVSMDVRRNILSPALLKLLYDATEMVQNEAFCSLGPFISTFAVPSVVNLVYTESGALVLRTNEGCEFRLTPCGAQDQDLVNGDPSFHFLPRELIRSVCLNQCTDFPGRPRRSRRFSGFASIARDGDTTGTSPITFLSDGEVDEESSSSYNSFQYWRDPIVENYVDLALLEESKRSPQRVEQNSLDEDWGEQNSLDEDWREQNSLGDNWRSTSPTQVVKLRCRFLGVKQNPRPVQNVIPEELLDAFLSMTFVVTTDDLCSDMNRLCAHNLPAVAVTLGRDNWPCLCVVHRRLAEYFDPEVRRTVAASMHVIAAIVGDDVAVNDLVPIFYDMMDDEDSVKTAAMNVVTDFLRELPEYVVKDFLPRLSMFSDFSNTGDWRIRQEWAKQLDALMAFYSPADIDRYIKPLVVGLLRDAVAGVRETAMKVAANIIIVLRREADLSATLYGELVSEFANSSRWERRQLYAYLCLWYCENCGPFDGYFTEYSLPVLFYLSGDEVANVRLAVGRALKAIAKQDKERKTRYPNILNLQRDEIRISLPSDDIPKVLKTLQNDIDFDVRYYACDDE